VTGSRLRAMTAALVTCALASGALLVAPTASAVTAVPAQQVVATSGEAAGPTTAASAPNEPWSNLAYGNGVWVAVSSSGDVMTSPDGIDWTQTRDADDGTWSDVDYGNGVFVALNSRPSSTGLQSMTSTDGVTWTTHAGSSRVAWTDLAYGNGVWVAVGYGNYDSDKKVMTSPDGITWTPRSSASDRRIWLDVTYGDGRFVAVSQGTSTKYAWTMTSTDGINWTGGAAPSPTRQTWSSVTYGDGLFVAVSGTGDGDRVMTSPDGVTWTRQSTPGASRSWSSVTYGDGLFVAVLGQVNCSKYRRPVMTSPDGITWTLRDGAKRQAWTEVHYANGRFVSLTNCDSAYVGTDRVMSSTDGLTWSLEYAQSITFAEPASQLLGDGSLALSASASSSLAVSYDSSTTSVCTVSGSTVSFVAAGTCSITASQAGDSTYGAAADVTRSFDVGKAAQTITFAKPDDDSFASGSVTLAGTASSNLAVSYSSDTTGVCTVSGADVTYVSPGTCTITASQAGNGTYDAAADVTRSFAVGKVAQAITFAKPDDDNYSSGSVTLSGTASSNLAVSYSSDTTSVCTVSGAEVTYVSPGTCTITASQAGNGTYDAAADVTRSFAIAAPPAPSLPPTPGGGSQPGTGPGDSSPPSGPGTSNPPPGDDSNSPQLEEQPQVTVPDIGPPGPVIRLKAQHRAKLKLAKSDFRMRFKEPRFDGGSPITGYKFRIKVTGKSLGERSKFRRWSKWHEMQPPSVTPRVISSDLPRMKRLRQALDGMRVHVQVVAENKAGASPKRTARVRVATELVTLPGNG
jgi:hypothetical protein